MTYSIEKIVENINQHRDLANEMQSACVKISSKWSSTLNEEYVFECAKNYERLCIYILDFMREIKENGNTF